MRIPVDQKNILTVFLISDIGAHLHEYRTNREACARMMDGKTVALTATNCPFSLKVSSHEFAVLASDSQISTYLIS